MRRIWTLIRNDFLREFNEPVSLVFFIILPLVFTAVIGTGLSGMMNADEEVTEWITHLYVINEDTGNLSETFLDTLTAVNIDVEVVDTLPEDSFGLEIPPEFSEQLLEGEAITLTLHTLPASVNSTVVEQAVSAARGRIGGAAIIASMGLKQAREAEAVTTAEEEAAFFDEIFDRALDAVENPAITREVRWPEGVIMDTSDNMVTSAEQGSAGQLVTWVQITLLGAAEVFVDERLRGTLKRMLISPTSRSTVLMGKLISRLAMGLLQMAILLVGGALIFGVDWGNDPLAIVLISFSFALAMAGMGMLLATFVESRGQASSAVVGFSMAMAALGGAWWPIEVTPLLYRQVVQILPSTWAMQAYGDVLARGSTTMDILPAVGVLLLFAAVFIAAGMLRFNKYE
ncbi:MAG: ABC transporter permease [Anaerolineae bacterium]|nr:ABC transporter permease [Anaerolineae bacterium]